MKISFSRAIGLGLAAALIGCGGGSGGSGGTELPTPVSFQVTWAERTMNLPAPATARSLKFHLAKALPSGGDLSFTADRTDTAPGYTQIYQTAASARPGTYNLGVDFFADHAAAGSLVATASASVRVLSNGTLALPNGGPLGDISVTGKVASVALTPDQSINKGQTVQLHFTAKNAAGQLIALSPGSAAFAVTAGSNALSVTPAGMATGLAGGTADVSVTIVGVPVGTGSVTVVPPAEAKVRELNQSTRRIVFDPKRNLIYGSVPGSDPNYPNKLIVIRPSDGVITNSVSVGSEPNILAISSDSDTIFVGLDGSGTVRKVDAATLTAGAEFDVKPGDGSTVADMKAMPGQPNSVAIIRSDGVGAIYDGGVMRAKTVGAGNVLALDETGSTMFSASGGTLRRSTIDATGLTAGGQKSAAQSYWPRVSYANGKVYTGGFQQFAAADLALTGTFPGREIDDVVFPEPDSDYVFTLTWTTPVRKVQVFSKTDFTRKFMLDISTTGGGAWSLFKYAPNCIAFNMLEGNSGRVYFVDDIPLP